MNNCIYLVYYMDSASRTLATCTALATLAAVTLRLFKLEESSASTPLKSVCKLVTETKQSVSQKEVTKPEPPGLFTGEATTSTLWSSE
jgi:hypothetical protein